MALDNATALPGVRVVTRFGNGVIVSTSSDHRAEVRLDQPIREDDHQYWAAFRNLCSEAEVEAEARETLRAAPAMLVLVLVMLALVYWALGALDEYFSYGEQPATAEQVAQFTAGSTCHREQVQSELIQGRLLINDDLDRLSRRCLRMASEAQEVDRSRQQIAAQRNAVSGL
ncbi:hypothetical protein HKW97_23380 (plasmid) [Pseudomonas luteola]|uniref:hypothetical protein n=1 Tax=Pseudomonas luteola TaxID=47886 RepID=UPI00388F0607